MLWVSLRCQPGLMSRVVCLLRAKVPMLRLLAHSPESRHDGRSRRATQHPAQAGDHRTVLPWTAGHLGFNLSIRPAHAFSRFVPEDDRSALRCSFPAYADLARP